MTTTQFHRANVATCHNATGVIVVVDVLRAFTTTAFAFERGVKEILLVSTPADAFAIRRHHPDYLLIGEVDGLPIDGFDLPNSPSAISELDLRDRRLVMRTTAGTQGVALAAKATEILVASLTVATATARYLQTLSAPSITFVDTGVRDKGGGEEDVICSDYIISRMQSTPLRPSRVQQRVQHSKAAGKFAELGNDKFPTDDLACACELDKFDFVMRVDRSDGYNRLRKISVPGQ